MMLATPVIGRSPCIFRGIQRRRLAGSALFKMDVFSRIIASRLFAWMALVTPGIVLLVIPTLNGELGIDPLKELFHRSGEIAVWTLRRGSLSIPVEDPVPGKQNCKRLESASKVGRRDRIYVRAPSREFEFHL